MRPTLNLSGWLVDDWVSLGFITIFFLLGLWGGGMFERNRIQHTNKEFQAELDRQARTHGRIPDTYCAQWFEKVPVHERWEPIAVATKFESVKQVCLVKGEAIYTEPENKP